MNNEGAPTILYTGVRGDWTSPNNQRVCLASGTKDLLSWEKHAGNPVIAPPDGQEQTVVFYDAARIRLGVDRRRSTLDQTGKIFADVQEGALEVSPGEPLRLRVFLDFSVIAVYANDCACITSRVYPNRSDSTGVCVYARGEALAKSSDIWRLSAIWEMA